MAQSRNHAGKRPLTPEADANSQIFRSAVRGLGSGHGARPECFHHGHRRGLAIGHLWHHPRSVEKNRPLPGVRHARVRKRAYRHRQRTRWKRPSTLPHPLLLMRCGRSSAWNPPMPANRITPMNSRDLTESGAQALTTLSPAPVFAFGELPRLAIIQLVRQPLERHSRRMELKPQFL
jgi:hypothetical protein